MRLDRWNRLIREGRGVEGTWRLTPSHDLEYRRYGAEEEILVSGRLASARPNGLTFGLAQRGVDGDTRSRELTLRGRWQADPRNRLTFLAQRRDGREEALVLQGGWELGEQHEVLYRIERTDPPSGRGRTIHQVRFEGYWEIDEERRLSYVLDRQSDSAFRFRGAFQTASLQPKEGSLRYQVGVEVGGRRQLQTVTLFGRWKLSRQLALELEVPYGSARRAMRFGASFSPGGGRTVLGRLTTRGGKPLGLEVTLTQEFLKDQGEAFLRLRRSLEETAVEGGVRIRW